MRSILFFLLLFISNSFLNAQIARKPVKVLDFGQLYSTFNWDATAAQLRAELGNTLAETVMAGSTESSWPSGIASLDTRVANRPMMSAYKLFHLTSLNHEVAVLVAPVTENRHMPADMLTGKDIYFVFGLDAVDLGETATPAAGTPTPAPAQDFAGQLNQIAADFGNGFANLTGAQIGEDEEGLMVQYESRAPLEGSRASYFIEDLLAASTTFHAEFPSSTDPVVALKSYRKLVAQIAALKLSCCGLQKQPETIEGSKHAQVFKAYDPAGKLSIEFQNMIIEIRIEQGETFDKKGQLVSDWIPVLDIYEQ